MGSIGFWELVVIFIVILLVVRPNQMPNVAKRLGIWWGKWQKWLSYVRREADHIANDTHASHKDSDHQ